jgi:hypothetical protein
VFCSFLALLLKQELESRMKRADLHWEWVEVIRALDNLQQVQANSRADAFYSVANSWRMLRKRCALLEWHYRRLYVRSSNRVQGENVVPRPFWAYVSRSTTAFQNCRK